MRVVFLGCTKFSMEILQHLISEKVEIAAICTIPEYFNISYSKTPIKNTNYVNLEPVSYRLGVKYFEVNSVRGQRLSDYLNQLEALKPDVLLAMGWYYMIPKKVRDIATYGAWGIHASLLPKYAGGAPLVWAIIEGQQETGVTLFQFDNGVDDGDIIMQEKFAIEEEDTIREVYEKATIYSKIILTKVLVEGKLTFTPQDKSAIEIYPQRSPEDGEIDWSWSSKQIKNFIRAQTKPYPGAWTIINGKKIILWDADIIES